MNKIIKFSSTIILLLFIVGCGGRKFVKPPVDVYIAKFVDEQNFAIILEDMNVEGTFFKTYKHRYKIVLELADGTPVKSISEWMEVEENYFWASEKNLGMTLCYKKDGKLEKNVSPPGYQYVGNKRYGEWRSHGGNSFWAFYGQYMFMSSMFGMMNRPVYRNEYNTYRGGYYGSNKGYYGPTAKGGLSKYGTNSLGTRKDKPGFFSRRASRTGWSGGRGRSGF
ncbi:MAG: hypothetical protein JKX73_03535, partial [Flavobacteriales bacterium]|nr:hypothetical protein [Flavobacteriales bacterium]